MRSLVFPVSALVAVGWLAIDEAVASPLADCNGVGVVVDSFSNVVVGSNGSVGCVVQNEATLNIYDGATRAAIPLGSSTTSYTYNAGGDLSGDTATPPIATHYDALDRLITVTNPPDTTTFESYQYDSQSRLTQATNPAGNPTHYEYDATSRQTSMIDALGNQTNTQYDSQDRVVSQIDPNTNTFRFQYQYDTSGRLSEVIDPAGDMVTFQYDTLGRLKEVIDPLGNIQFFYDAAGQLVDDIDQNLDITAFTYDANGRLIADNDLSGTTTSFVFTHIVPEPGTLALFLSGIGVWLSAMYRRRFAA